MERMHNMCGIFGFSLEKPIPVSRVFSVLEKLEIHQFPDEPTPVGGYGAGIALLLEDGGVLMEKIGKTADSPVKKLASRVKATKASALISHVRMPSPEFMKTAIQKETAQPYVVEREQELTVVSVHNGKVENYRELRKILGSAHVFESEKIELIDSEVIPHYFEETFSQKENVPEALQALFCSIKGSSSAAMLQLEEEESFLHLLHKGKTRGLNVWTNDKNEVIFCSRKQPLEREFKNFLSHGKFKEKISIRYREEAGLILSFPLFPA
jgi:glucosamine 6-phosphate synthetase-like amidotransferase/phosphosugar isomerase protein